MKTFALASLFALATMATFMPAHSAATPLLRQRRDVSELSGAPNYNYLPPALMLAGEETTIAPVGEVEPIDEPQDDTTTVLGNNGYEYKTVRRLKFRYRQRRDVSHLPQSQYLPPPPPPSPPSNEYLPPLEPTTTTTTIELAPVEPKLANEYLPPATEAPEEEQATEAPSTEAAEVAEVKEAEAPVEETAILAEDGYHYKQPAEEPKQLKLIDVETYLPPAGDDDDAAVVVEGPEESAVLADDGYHYRSVKRLRF